MTIKRFIPLIVAAILLAFTASMTVASKPTPTHKVTLCHRAGSASNPYVSITVDIASVANAKDARGHDDHDQIGNGLGGDIIPTYTYNGADGVFTYPGKNLDALILGTTGLTILNNGCTLLGDPTVTPAPTPEQSIGEPSVSEDPSASAPPGSVPNTAMGDLDDKGTQTFIGFFLLGLSALLGLDLIIRHRRR